MDESIRLRLNPAQRLKAITNLPTPEVNSNIPLNRYYRSLNEVYRIAGFSMKNNELEQAISLYIRFVSLALDGLPKHKDYKNFSSYEKSKAEKSLKSALDCAEALKVRLRERYEADAVKARKILEERKAKEEAKQSSVDLCESSESGSGILTSPHDSAAEATSKTDIPEHIVHVPYKMMIAADIVEKFRKHVEKNTSLNIETCAVLCGKTGSGGMYQITHAVIPKQDGAPDSCDMHNEEDIFAFQDTHNLITLGWIHTHPSQTAFLSSVDLHTHCAYQSMLPESVAIVVAPKFNELGVFRLSQEGMKEVGNCNQKGFHPHDNASLLFHQCDDFLFSKELIAQIVDLR